jgi:hypothetical protein
MARRLRGKLLSNFRLKAASLLIAVGIWFYANQRVTEKVLIEAQLVVRPPAGYALVYQSQQTVYMRVSGPEALVANVQQLARSRPRAEYELHEAELAQGWASLRIRPEWLKLGLDEQEFVQLRFSEIEPKYVEVLASPVEQVAKPVRVVVTGSPPEGFQLAGEPRPVPDKVTVKGPSVAVRAMEYVPTDPLPIWNLRAGRHSPQLNLKAQTVVELDSGSKVSVPLELSDSQVTARIDMVEELAQERTFEGLPLLLMVPPTFPYEVELDATVQEVSVTVKARPLVLERLDRGVLSAYVDVSGLAGELIEPGSMAPYQEEVQVHLPPDVENARASAKPSQVTLLLRNPVE